MSLFVQRARGDPIKHLHHIVPKHAGGTDDPTNLVELSLKEHAEAHKLLWEQYGRWQDRLAWLGLSSQIGNEEIIRLAQLEGCREGGRITGAKYGKINSETGFIKTISTKESCSIGGKEVTSRETWKETARKGGTAASKKNIESGQLASLSRKVKSKEDGTIISWNNKHHHERKTGFKHTWENIND